MGSRVQRFKGSRFRGSTDYEAFISCRTCPLRNPLIVSIILIWILEFICYLLFVICYLTLSGFRGSTDYEAFVSCRTCPLRDLLILFTIIIDSRFHGNDKKNRCHYQFYFKPSESSFTFSFNLSTNTFVSSILK